MWTWFHTILINIVGYFYINTDMRIKAFEIANCFLFSKEQKRTTFMVQSDHLRLSCSIQTWIKNRRAINKAINKLVHMLSFQCGLDTRRVCGNVWETDCRLTSDIEKTFVSTDKYFLKSTCCRSHKIDYFQFSSKDGRGYCSIIQYICSVIMHVTTCSF